MSAANAIKKYLDKKGMTQTELAKALGITRQNLSNQMSRDNFTLKELYKISRVLGFEIVLKGSEEYIIDYSSEK